MKSPDAFIDNFVALVNASDRPFKLADEVAPSVAEPIDEDADLWSWSIRPYPVTWVGDIEARLSRRLPPPFRSLVTRYVFPEFEWGSVLFFANTPEQIGYAGHELRVAIFRDVKLFQVLSQHGYVQFGQPSTGSYDPVCFAPSDGEDASVVRIDHEDILIRGELRVIEQIAPTFQALVGRWSN